ncbi:MAG: TerB family tellurite resistance protein, partial [Rhizobiaceae bacterium]
HAELRYALATLFDLDEPGVAHLVTAGEDAERHSVDVQGFTSVLNRHLDEAARRAFVEELFELVFADRDANELEDSMVWRISQLMGVSPEESDRIRHSVASRAGDGEA